jgi:hypothetical protein
MTFKEKLLDYLIQLEKRKREIQGHMNTGREVDANSFPFIENRIRIETIEDVLRMMDK